MLQVRIKGRYTFFTAGDAINIPLNQAKLFRFTPADFMTTSEITNLHFT